MRQSNFKTIKVSEVKTGWMPSFDKFNPPEYHGPPRGRITVIDTCNR